jgi:cation-transporting P-type ATPase E
VRRFAPVVLGDSSFTALPAVVAEGRRVIGNIERVANLFVTKTVYASFLALAVGVAGLPFPFLPRHLTIISALTIGIPAFLLALAPYAQPARPGFERRVARFAIPSGLVAGIVTLAAFAVARAGTEATMQARTVATVSLFLIGLRLLSVLARSMSRPLRSLLLAAMATTFGLILAVEPLRTTFALQLPPIVQVVESGGVVALGLVLLELVVVRAPPTAEVGGRASANGPPRRPS